MNPHLEQLHDIEGIDAISVWPLALGWWLVIAAVISALLLLLYLIYRRLSFRSSWRYAALKELERLEQQLSEENRHATAVALSQWLRRLAIERSSRELCAGLKGQQWLCWLSDHDPKGFDWQRQGRFLIEQPYAPDTQPLSTQEMTRALSAAKSWVYTK